MIHYRTFRNDDPPALVAIWNEVFTGRGAAALRGASPLEYFVFAKPYFDPRGLILAVDDRTPVAFVHAGFGPDATQKALDRTAGVTCLFGVRPTYRRQGLGTELLNQAEEYLREQGAKTLHVGGLPPLNPFYLGLLGGSDTAGILDSDSLAGPFLRRRGYEPRAATFVFQRRLNKHFNVADARFAGLRRRFDVRAVLRSKTGTWWQECVLGPLELLDFHVVDRATGTSVARVGAWEMQGFSQRWNVPSVGLMDLEVHPDHRRQGIARFLLTQVLRQVQEQYFEIVEMHAPDDNQAAVELLRGLAFEQVDTGRRYTKG